MKTVLIATLLMMSAAVAVYLVSSLRNIAREDLKQEEWPQGTFEITSWVSDAGGTACILRHPAGSTAFKVSEGLGRKTSEGYRPSHDCLGAVEGKAQMKRIVERKRGEVLGYIVASERLEIEVGYNLLARNVVIFIRDPEDTHHRSMREAP